MTIPDPIRRTRSTPLILREDSEPGNARQRLREEREYKNIMSTERPPDTISPHLAAILGASSSNETLISAIAAMKPGSAEVEAGFIPVQLARTFDTTSPDKPAKKQLGSGGFGIAYEVRLSEDFLKDGRNLGRDFVFKAMLRTDWNAPLPKNLYDRLPDDHAAEALVRERISKAGDEIFNEFQIAASLVHTSRVMQVHGLVQIGDEFGILAEKIDGETARNLQRKSIDGLKQGVISPEEHLSFAKQVVADVLVGVSLFADAGLTHLDISPNNVLYDKKEKHFKLIDMGKGREEGEEKEMGTMGYYDPFAATADQKSDVYSAGQLLVNLLKNPEISTGPMGLFGKRTVDTFPFMNELAKLSLDTKEEIVNLISRMTAYSVAERPTAQEVLRDTFLQKLASPKQIHAYYEKLNKLPGN